MFNIILKPGENEEEIWQKECSKQLTQPIVAARLYNEQAGNIIIYNHGI